MLSSSIHVHVHVTRKTSIIEQKPAFIDETVLTRIRNDFIQSVIISQQTYIRDLKAFQMKTFSIFLLFLYFSVLLRNSKIYFPIENKKILFVWVKVLKSCER